MSPRFELEEDLDGWVERLQAEQAERAQHEQVCRRRPCERCARYECPRCGGDMFGPRGAEYRLGDEVRSGCCASCAAVEERRFLLRAAMRSVPERFRDARLDAQEIMRSRLANPQVCAIARAELNSTHLLLQGETAVGKTTLVAAMFHTILDRALDPNASPETVRQAARARFVSARALAEDRFTHPIGHGVPPVVQEATDASLLVLDDLGNEAHPVDAVRDVILKRHDGMQPTWYTTGLSDDDLEKRYGGAVARRILEEARTIPLRPRATALRAVTGRGAS